MMNLRTRKTYLYLVFNMDELRIVKGNAFETIVEVGAYKYNGEYIKDFDLSKCTNIRIILHS